jgi:hypothetical protein
MSDSRTTPGGGRQGGEGPGKWIALVLLVALAGLCVYLVNAMIRDVRLQNCVLSGRRDCLEISAPSGS